MLFRSSFVECGVNAALYEEKGIVAVYGTGVPKECFFVKNMSATNSGPRISAIGAAQSLKDQFDVKSLVCIAGNIPSGSVNVVREDPQVKDLLYAGNDFGAYVSKNAGKTWQVLGRGLPSVQVSDLQVHPRDHVIVISTYGRGMYVMDATKVRAVK